VIGAIAGDVIGSVHEYRPAPDEWPLFVEGSVFTDDTVLTVATAHAILNGAPYGPAYLAFGRRYPNAGYGASFYDWLRAPDPRPYNSWGNGSAMRVSPVGYAFDSEERVLAEARESAAVTHNHPEGIKGAQATALAVFLARTGASKEAIRERIAAEFEYDLNRTVAEIKPAYTYEISCQKSVPEAIIAFLDSTSFEDAIRLAISLGGDADTQAAIAGGIAQAFYRDVPPPIVTGVRALLPDEFLEIIDAFEHRFAAAYNSQG
jgi:ADP-ribosylglycohydrolase